MQILLPGNRPTFENKYEGPCEQNTDRKIHGFRGV